ncbi:MAG: right-handed parallel beta-helix repeat-containing protein, partial [Bacteroidales bacterium]|nr:right-handed parallel beta-helix repeat-containing protein [Bacteroidales bacterium]
MSKATVPSIVPAVRYCLLNLLLSLFITQTAFTQLNGTYTIGKDGDFKTFTGAAAELNKTGVSGPVTFSVQNGIYEEQFTLGLINNTAPHLRVIFRSESGNPEDVTLRFAAASKEENFIVRLQASQHIEFRDITFEATGLGRVFYLEASAGNIVVAGCTLSGIYNTNAVADPALIFSQDPNLENLNIIGNRFLSCSFGVYLQGAFNNYIHGLRFLDNIFSNTGYASINLIQVNNPLISGNTIQGGYFGIHVTSGAGLTLVKNSVSVSGHGIRLNYVGNLVPGLIANNFIRVDGVSESYGLDIQNSSWMNVYHNTVVINTHMASARAFNCSSNTAGTINVINNSFSCMNEGYASYVQYPATLLQSDHNNYYSASSMMFYRGQKAYDLADLKMLGAHDQHSISVWPGHLSDTDLHVYTGWMAGKGSPLSEVTEDIDGDPRSTLRPDIGADEFSTGTMFLPPLSGDYTIGPGQTYETLQSAIDVMKTRGISGPVRLRLTAGIHDEQAELVT